MTVKQQGAPLQVKAHLATLYYAPGQSILSSILHTRPLLTTFTPPFMFHSSDDAIAGITTTLIEIATDYI